MTAPRTEPSITLAHRRARIGSWALLGLASLAIPRRVHADEARVVDARISANRVDGEGDAGEGSLGAERLEAGSAEVDALASTHLFAALSFGKGLRLNNPYRLGTVLGEDAASLSATALYLDGSAGFAYGPGDGLQHGAQLHLGAALEGVRQPFVSASYLVAIRPDDAWWLYGRLGPSFLLAPDPNVGGELALSASWFFSQGLGLTSELVGNVYYGAATLDRQASVVPIVSLQLGLVADYEVLP